MPNTPSLAALADDLASGRTSARKLVDACLAKIADSSGEGARVFEAGGIRKQLRIYRLPETNDCRRAHAKVRVPLHRGRDNAIYLRATTEDGHWIWSSPVYVTHPDDAHR